MSKLLAVVIGTFVLPAGPLFAQDADPASWPAELDAVTAAPDSHEVLYEDENVRLLSVSIAPGEEEPMHHHRSPSAFVLEFRNQAGSE